MAALYIPDTLFQRMAIDLEPWKGRDAVGKIMEDFFKAFPDTRYELRNTVATGDTVAAEALVSGTSKGPLEIPTGTIPPTNRRLELRQASFIRVNPEGLIVEDHRYFDIRSMMQQLGLKA